MVIWYSPRYDTEKPIKQNTSSTATNTCDNFASTLLANVLERQIFLILSWGSIGDLIQSFWIGSWKWDHAHVLRRFQKHCLRLWRTFWSSNASTMKLISYLCLTPSICFKKIIFNPFVITVIITLRINQLLMVVYVVAVLICVNLQSNRKSYCLVTL